MIPEQEDLLLGAEIEISTYPSKTYKMDFEKGRIIGYVDEKEAVRQAIQKILSTERYCFGAYSNNYGSELTDLIGMPTTYVLPEIERCVKEALTWDSRIESVDNFVFERQSGKVHCTFTVHTVYGDIETETVVNS